jgi:hypothetical protein
MENFLITLVLHDESNCGKYFNTRRKT